MRSDGELSSVLDTEKLNDGLSSERLRNFYRKLIQTDAQIRNLKKGVSDYSSLKNINENNYGINDRFKRSLKLRGPRYFLRLNTKKEAKEIPLENMAELNKFNLFYPPFYAVNSTKKKSKRKFKRHVNGTDEPTGFLIEKKQILVQYKPHDSLKKVPKCSHAPKESKSHETQLKHPFYKNTQRLDELLDKFMDKNLPEIMVDPFGVDVLFKQKEKDKHVTHKTNLKIETEKPTTRKSVAKVKNNENVLFGHKSYKPKLNKEFFGLVTNKQKLNGKVTSSSTPIYDVVLSVSTIVNPGLRKVTKSFDNMSRRTPSLLERVPHIRKLMQVEEKDDEILGYEDLKEVLADESETHDETDKVQDRKKRMEDNTQEDPKVLHNPSKFNPPGVHNPNWKGPMPLYPDELNSMIHQAAIQNVNKIQIPVNTKDVPAEIDGAEKFFNDIEYIENYSDNKFDRLVKMAQAYSDYGVLEGKKELVRTENKPIDGKGVERIVKLSVNKGKSLKNALLTKFKKRKCTVSEGIRFEFRPTTNTREDPPIEIMKMLQKHVKVTNPTLKNLIPRFHVTQIPHNNEYTLLSAAIEKETSPSRGKDQLSKKIEALNDYSDDGGVVFTLAKNDITTMKFGNYDEYPDSSVVFTLAKTGKRTTKSIFERIESNFDDSIHKDISVVSIGKRSLKSINLANDENNIDSGDLQSIVQENNNSMNSYKSKELFDIDKKLLNSQFSSDDTKVKSTRTKRDVSNLNLYPTNHTSVADNKNNLTEEKTISISENISKSFNLFDDNNIFTKLISANRNSSEMDVSDFFRMMANFFGLLAQSENSFYNETTTTTVTLPESNIIKFTTKNKFHNVTKSNKTLDIEFPMYDSDMIENIGHRSRVLLAVNEVNDKISTDGMIKINSSSGQEKEDPMTHSVSVPDALKSFTTVSVLPSTIEHTTSNINLLSSNEPTISFPIKDIGTAKHQNIANRSLVKRNAPEESNFIFWNDIYDDEYGIKLDPIENAVRDKHNVKGVDLMKKSGNWIQDKVKSIASNFRRDKIMINNGKKRLLRGAKYFRSNPYTESIRDRYVKRAAKYDSDEFDEKSNSFSALTAKMKEVCKEAAKAVQQTRNVKVRQNEKEDTMTTSLMQQLVRLMTDLVDFQVQQKTCVKLPPDLQEFLEWLTAPSSEQVELKNSNTEYHKDMLMEKQTEEVLDLITTPSSEKEEVHLGSRSDCLGTLHAVQDLMQQFDEMADEDKSKMTGIREYLENQLQFLHRQLSAFDDKVPTMFEENPMMRFRRDLAKSSGDQKRFENYQATASRKRRFKRKFLKNFGKKHTRTTASIYDGYPITENKLADIHGKSDQNIISKRKVKQEKRNLRDVYYKALEDAKKSTTFKNVHKEELSGFDNAQIVRIEN